MDKTWTVYMHISPSGKRYIGITCRSKAKYRWGRDGIKYKNNQHFWNAIQKYGWENFEHIIISTDLSHDNAKSMEIELISEFQSNLPQYGYNKTLGGDGTFGYKHKPESIKKMKNREFSKETRDKIREKAKLRKGDLNPMYHKHHSEDSKQKMSNSSKLTFINKPNPHNKKIDQYDLDGNYLRSFASAMDVKRTLGISNSHISSCCNGTRKSAGGYMWKFSKREELS